jgi:hypothetical protein
MPRYCVTETLTIQTYVTANDEEQARTAAYKRLPDYGRAGWELTGSDGPVIREVKL